MEFTKQLYIATFQFDDLHFLCVGQPCNTIAPQYNTAYDLTRIMSDQLFTLPKRHALRAGQIIKYKGGGAFITSCHLNSSILTSFASSTIGVQQQRCQINSGARNCFIFLV